MGLRADKQRSQRHVILENAFAYMCEHEGQLPTVTELARTCSVSDATVFNYVGQRDAIHSEWAHRNLSELCHEVAAEGGGSLRRALRRVQRALENQAGERPAVWLRIWSQASGADPSVGRPGGALPGAADPGLTALVRLGQTRGEIRGDVEAETQAAALVGAWLAALACEARRARQDGGASFDDAAWKRVAASVELVLDGMRKRNERVRMTARGAPRPVTPSAQGPS